MQALIIGLVLFLSPLLGALGVGFLMRRQGSLRYFLVFTGAYLLAISLLSLLPEVFAQADLEHVGGFYLLGGFVLQAYLEQFTGGIEHGHMQQNTQGMAPAILVGLGVHALLEGMLLNTVSLELSNMVFGAILLHKLPAGAALMVSLRSAGLPPRKLWGALIAFALASPLGMVLGEWTLLVWLQSYVYGLFAVVVGMLLHLSTRMVIEGSPTHRYDRRVNMATIGGIALALVQHVL